MPHIHPVTPAEATGEVSDLYDELTKIRGSVPNLFQLLGHSPKMLGPALALANFAGSSDSRVPAKHKQLAYLTASRLNYCDYCLKRHAVAGARAGLTPAQIDLILDPTQPDLLDSPLFNAKEKLIIEYSLELTVNADVELATAAALKEFFDDEEYLELTFVISTANMFNRLAGGLAVELEPEYIKPS